MVEMTIAVVIVSVLTVALVSAHAVADRTIVLKLVAEMRDVETMLNAYKDRYGDIPGDDIHASRHMTGAISARDWPFSAVSGNGKIDGLWANDYLNAGDESTLFWNHVRLAGLAPGNPATAPMLNAVGGRLGITSGTALPTRPAKIPGLYSVCTAKVPGALARLVDVEMDDGDATTGKVWAAVETVGVWSSEVMKATAPSPYLDTKFYSVCTAF